MSDIVDLSIYTHAQLADMNVRQREMVKQAWGERDKAEDSLRKNKNIIASLNRENETLLAQVESLTKQLNAQTEPMTMWHTRKIRDLAARVDALQKANDNQITMHDANRKATNEKKLSCGCVITASIVPAPCSAPFTEGDQIRLVLNVKECTGLCGEFLFKNITIKATPFVPKGTFFVINGLP